MKIVEPSAELLWITPDPLAQIERAARTCYKSEDLITPESAQRMVRSLIERGHEAMLEHASASIKFVCDRGVSHELVRHRLCGFAQESTRYCNYSKDKFDNQITYIMPPDLTPKQKETWEHAMLIAEQCYDFMIHYGAAPQIARSVLPNSLKTEIVCTANMREWRHIFKLRTAPAAHPQIKQVMVYAWNILYKEAPELFEGVCSV